MTKNWIIGISLIAVIVIGGLFILNNGFNGTTGVTQSIGYDLLDKDGNVISPIFGVWMIDGSAVSGIRVTLTWTITGSDNVDWDTILVEANLKATLEDLTGTAGTVTLDEKITETYVPTGSLVIDIMFDEDITWSGMVERDYILHFTGSVMVDIGDVDGRQIAVDDWTGGIDVPLHYDPDIQTVNIDGYITQT